MRITVEEQEAIREVLERGAQFGYGNLISHLQTAWARHLVRTTRMSEKTARLTAGGPGYPFAMQDDIVNWGEWDETGKRYRTKRTKA